MRFSIAIWPDGTWCWQSELSQMSHMSDDYMRVDMPEWYDDEDAAYFAERVRRFGWTVSDIDNHIRLQLG